MVIMMIIMACAIMPQSHSFNHVFPMYNMLMMIIRQTGIMLASCALLPQGQQLCHVHVTGKHASSVQHAACHQAMAAAAAAAAALALCSGMP